MRRSTARAISLFVAFLRSRQGGGMLVGGALAISLLAGIGGTMTNYAWREAQIEELRSAVRAAVSAAGPLLAGAGGSADAAIEERVGAFLAGLVPGLSLDSVTVTHDVETGMTSVSVAGDYLFASLWATGSDEPEPVEETVGVKLEVDRYEVAVALDVSSSMLGTMPSGIEGVSIVMMEGLKNAMGSVLTVVEEASKNDPGSIMVSMVPFGVAVNVADTCNPDPDTGLCRAAHSPAKERYVRMLAGPHATTAATLAAARTGGRHWVDTFHHYGAGSNLGPLWARSLPDDLLDGRDWNLRREDVEVDVSAVAPSLDTGAGPGIWAVDDEDFWNGCVMARWGAYWDAQARPPGWTADATAVNWPSTQAVPGWSPAAAGLPAKTPLHFSDAPPDAADPNTLFTAYSYPDARIGSTADHRLQSVMLDLLEPDWRGGVRAATQGDNDWSVGADRAGASMCPPAPLMPLTEDVDVLRSAIDRLGAIPRHGPFNGLSANYLHLGVVWGLRTISPLWRDVWQVEDAAARSRPATPCAAGDAAVGCDTDLHKSILIVSDGSNDFGTVARGRQNPPSPPNNARFGVDALSGCIARRMPTYSAAAGERSEDAFNTHFSDFVDADGHFAAGGMTTVLDAFHARGDPLADEDARRSLRENVLTGVTPWQIFRGVDRAGAIDGLLDSDNEFGFSGRPVQLHHFCGWSSLFGAYGRIDDAIRVGESGTLPATLLDPVHGAAPFNVDSGLVSGHDIRLGLSGQLDDWLYESCTLAGQRGVRIHAIYMGSGDYSPPIDVLKECVRSAGGDPERDVYVTPTAQGLTNAFTELFTIRRNLRFLN